MDTETLKAKGKEAIEAAKALPSQIMQKVRSAKEEKEERAVRKQLVFSIIRACSLHRTVTGI